MSSIALLKVQAQQLTRMESPPELGTFYSVQLTNQPPLPWNPMPDLDVYTFDGLFFYDDSSVDYVTLRQNENSSRMANAKSFHFTTEEDGPPQPGGDGGGDGGGETTNNFPPAYDYTTNQLWLEIVGVTNNAGYFAIHTPDTNGIYDLFSTTNLSASVPGLNLTNWLWLLRTEAAETNLVVTNLWPHEGWFELGTMQDSDFDGLTDAYERLVSHTDSSNPDSDSDGLSDYYEWLNNLSPLAAQGIPTLNFVSVPVCPVP